MSVNNVIIIKTFQDLQNFCNESFDFPLQLKGKSCIPGKGFCSKRNPRIAVMPIVPIDGIDYLLLKIQQYRLGKRLNIIEPIDDILDLNSKPLQTVEEVCSQLCKKIGLKVKEIQPVGSYNCCSCFSNHPINLVAVKTVPVVMSEFCLKNQEEGALIVAIPVNEMVFNLDMLPSIEQNGLFASFISWRNRLIFSEIKDDFLSYKDYVERNKDFVKVQELRVMTDSLISKGMRMLDAVINVTRKMFDLLLPLVKNPQRLLKDIDGAMTWGDRIYKPLLKFDIWLALKRHIKITYGTGRDWYWVWLNMIQPMLEICKEINIDPKELDNYIDFWCEYGGNICKLTDPIDACHPHPAFANHKILDPAVRAAYQAAYPPGLPELPKGANSDDYNICWDANGEIHYYLKGSPGDKRTTIYNLWKKIVISMDVKRDATGKPLYSTEGKEFAADHEDAVNINRMFGVSAREYHSATAEDILPKSDDGKIILGKAFIGESVIKQRCVEENISIQEACNTTFAVGDSNGDNEFCYNNRIQFGAVGKQADDEAFLAKNKNVAAVALKGFEGPLSFLAIQEEQYGIRADKISFD